jgi:hypothetical protein
MIAFQIRRHIEMNEGFQGLTLTEFEMEVDETINNDQIVSCFIRSKYYSFESLRDCVKAEPDKGYLRQAFIIDKIKITDFAKTDKQGITKFLFDFLNEPYWGDDRIEFALLLEWYFEIHIEFGDNEFYIVSMDWFSEEDERVHDPECSIYNYYFLIISVDRKLNLLTLTEWFYD